MICENTSIYSPVFMCDCRKEDVALSWNSKSLTLPEDMQKQVIEHWDELPKDHLFNGCLARLDDYSFTSQKCRFDLRPSDYRTLLYSNNNIQYICDTWGQSYLSRALGISAVLLSSDNQLLFMKRSANVGEFPECYDVFGGHIDVPDNGYKPSIFLSMEQELEEEVGLSPVQYELRLIALIESVPNQKPELIFVAKSYLSKNEIISLAKNARDKSEYTAIHTISNERTSIEDFMNKNVNNFSPSAFGSLCVYMKKSFVYGNEG